MPIDRPPLQAGFGGDWSSSSGGLVFLRWPSARAQTIQLPDVVDVALNSTRVFALSGAAQTVYSIDPATRQVDRRWKLHGGDTPTSLTATNSRVYVAFLGSPNRVEAVSLGTGRTVTRPVPHTTNLTAGRTIAYGGGTLWLTDGAKLIRLDPSTLAVRSSVRMISDPADCRIDIWFGDGSLWAGCAGNDVGVFRISAQTGRIVARRPDRGAVQIAFSPTAVWASSIIGPTALNPKSAGVQWTVPKAQVLGGDAVGIALTHGQVWVTYDQESELQRFPASLAR